MKTKRTALQDKLTEEMEKDLRFFEIGGSIDKKQAVAYRNGYLQGMGRALNAAMPYDKKEWEYVQKQNKLQEVA